jgi:hypothetical protein
MSEGTPPGPSPLEAERQRLRAQGYSDAEISQILVARALGGGGGPTGAPTQPQGAFSNVLNSIVAVASYAGGIFTTIRHDVATMLDRSAPTGARGGAFTAVAIKGIVIALLIFAGWQEWQQHIISQTQIAASQAEKLKAEADAAQRLNEAQAKKLQAEADAAKALNDAQVKKLEGEAAVSKQVNEAQAEKLRAEAGAAEQVAGGARAQACSARMKLLSENMYMDDINSDGSVKPGSRTAQMTEKYRADCGNVTGDTPSDPASDPGLAEAEKVLNGLVTQYQALKKANADNHQPDEIKAALNASCVIGARMGESWTHHDGPEDQTMTASSILTCVNAADVYSAAHAAHASIEVPGDFLKAPDEATKIRWGGKQIAFDLNLCLGRRTEYEGFLGCSCIAGARHGVAQVLPDGDQAARDNLVEKSEPICRRLSMKFAEKDGPDAAQKYHDMVGAPSPNATPSPVIAATPTPSFSGLRRRSSSSSRRPRRPAYGRRPLSTACVRVSASIT